MKYEGTLRIRINPEKKAVVLDRGIQSSTLTADNPVDILSKMVTAADEHKVGIDRWSLYIPGVSEKLNKTATTLSVRQVNTALEDESNEVFIRAGKWGKPQLIIAGKQTRKTSSKYIDIA